MIPSASPTPATPVPFGRYELLELLGEGAMAQVYRARRIGPVGFRKEVAIKRLRPSVVGRDDAMREALVNEARNGGLLRHPGIVEIYEFDRVDDEWYLAMEFVEGWTLEDVMLRAASGELPRGLLGAGGIGLAADVVLDLSRQMAEALAHAHEATDERGAPLRLVHRDLKPANVFLDRRGTVKIADFGLAKSRANVRQTTDADRTKGSPLYMSPEQVGGDALDGRSDLFAVGTLLVELSTGRAPFEGSSVANTLLKVLEVDWREVEPAMAAQAPVLDGVARRLLCKDRTLRYGSARALAEELARLAGGRVAGERSGALARGMAEGAPADSTVESTADLLDSPLRRTALQSVVARAPGGGWGLLVALLALLGALGVAFVLVLQTPPKAHDFEGVRVPVAEDLGPEEERAAADPPPAAPPPDEALAHAPPAAASLWQDLDLSVTERTSGPWSVTARYRSGGGGWRLLTLPCAGGVCKGAIPVTSTSPLEYFLEATGPGAARWGSGSAAAPIRVLVR